jgi:hypothetical protein
LYWILGSQGSPRPGIPPDRHANLDSDSLGDDHTHGHIDPDRDAHPGDADPHSHSHTHGHANGDNRAHRHYPAERDRLEHADAHIASNGDSYPDGDPHGHKVADFNKYRTAYTDANNYTDAGIIYDDRSKIDP